MCASYVFRNAWSAQKDAQHEAAEEVRQLIYTQGICTCSSPPALCHAYELYIEVSYHLKPAGAVFAQAVPFSCVMRACLSRTV